MAEDEEKEAEQEKASEACVNAMFGTFGIFSPFLSYTRNRLAFLNRVKSLPQSRSSVPKPLTIDDDSPSGSPSNHLLTPGSSSGSSSYRNSSTITLSPFLLSQLCSAVSSPQNRSIMRGKNIIASKSQDRNVGGKSKNQDIGGKIKNDTQSINQFGMRDVSEKSVCLNGFGVQDGASQSKDKSAKCPSADVTPTAEDAPAADPERVDAPNPGRVDAPTTSDPNGEQAYYPPPTGEVFSTGDNPFEA